MGTQIAWFSTTGNTLAVVRRLHEALEDAGSVPMAYSDPADLSGCDRLILAFPVYAWGPPVTVEKFVAGLRLAEETPVIAVMTSGGWPGPASKVLGRLLRKQGLTLQASYGVRMPDNYPPFGGAPELDRQREHFEDAEPVIADVILGIRENRAGRFENTNRFFLATGGLVHGLFKWSLRTAHNKFRVDDCCNGCGICAKVCPVDNIRMQEGRPAWLTHCEQCYACFHWCPQQAIQYGTRTCDQIRYHHPDITLRDILPPGDSE